MDYTTLAYAPQGESEDTSMTEGLGNEIEMTKGHTDPDGIFRRLWLFSFTNKLPSIFKCYSMNMLLQRPTESL
jgi:hypothetical protein